MDDLEFRRRVIAQWGIDDDKFKDFALGYIGSNPTTNLSNGIWRVALTSYIPVIPGHSITFSGGLRCRITGDAYSCIWYKSDKSYSSYNDQNPQPRTVVVSSSYYFLRVVVDMDNLANAYVYDNTTGEYLWRGSDYV